MTRRDRMAAEAVDGGGGGLALDTPSDPDPVTLTGPHDGDDLDPEATDALGSVDFGSIRLPVPPRGTVTVEPTANGRMQAVHIALPEGRLSVSALAAPKSSKLWPQLAREIDTSLRDGGALVRSFTGHWGRELHATSGAATSVFVGVDGPRWMLYGVATGATQHAEALDGELRRMLRGTVVVRGKSPYPVRTILPLTVPEHLAVAQADAAEAAAAGTAAPAKKASKKGAQKKAGPKNASPKKSAQTRTGPKKTAPKKAAAAAAPVDTGVQRAAEAEAARAARTGAPEPSISTGPRPDAPLHEQAPSARRAAAASWRSRPGPQEPPPVEPVQADLPPTEALRLVEPGSGGRRRLRESGVDPGVESATGGRRRLHEPIDDAYDPGPGSATGGRRRLREPDPAASRGEPAAHRDQIGTTGGRRRLREPDALGPAEPADRRPERTGPWEPEAAAGRTGGRRRLREPDAVDRAEPGVPRDVDAPVSRTAGRRRLREPDDATGARPGAAGGGPQRSGAWDLDVPADPPAGRRRLREPDPGSGGPEWAEPHPPRNLDPPPTRRPGGRRRLQAPDGAAGVESEPGRAADRPAPWEAAGPGSDRRAESAPAGSGGADRASWELDEPARGPGRDGRWEPTAGGALPGTRSGGSDSRSWNLDEPTGGGVLPGGGSGGADRAHWGLDEPAGELGRDRRWEPAADDDVLPGTRSGARERAPWDPDEPAGGPGGRRRLPEPDAGAPADVPAAGRRRAVEPDLVGPDRDAAWDLDAPVGRRRREPDVAGARDPQTPGAGRRRRRDPEPFDKLGTGGRRHLTGPHVGAAPDLGGRRGAEPGEGAREPDGQVSAGNRAIESTVEAAVFGPGGRPSWASEFDAAWARRERTVEPDRPVESTAEAPPLLGPDGRWSWESDIRPVEPGVGDRSLPDADPPRPWESPHATGDAPFAEPPASGSGRRRRREPDGPGFDGASYGDALAGPGGRRRRPEPPPPTRDGASTQPGLREPEWGETRHGAPDVPAEADRGGRRTLGSEYLLGIGADAVRDDAFDPPDDGAARSGRAGRHSAPDPGKDALRTVPLRTLLGDQDAGPSSGRHRRRG